MGVIYMNVLDEPCSLEYFLILFLALRFVRRGRIAPGSALVYFKETIANVLNTGE
jgi:hypothetical protein